MLSLQTPLRTVMFCQVLLQFESQTGSSLFTDKIQNYKSTNKGEHSMIFTDLMDTKECKISETNS